MGKFFLDLEQPSEMDYDQEPRFYCMLIKIHVTESYEILSLHLFENLYSCFIYF